MTDGPQQLPQLDYPQIFLDFSLESLLSHSNAGRMTTSAPESHLEPDNLLSESWATLSNSDYSREDDLRSETTDVGSLVSNNGTEDVHSIEDDLESEDDEEQLARNNDVGSSQGTDTLAQRLPPASSSFGHQGVATLGNDDFSAIEFEEPRTDSWPEAGQVDVKHTVQIFNEAEARQILEAFPPSTNVTQLVGTVRMSMSRTSLELERPLRVFYAGDLVARDDILVKIASALLAGVDPASGYRDLESSRYHILPQHYGPGAPSGGADLVPIQKTQIIVDEIKSACYGDKCQSEIDVGLKNGSHYSSRRKGSKYDITSTTQSFVPDMALFYTSEDDSPLLRQILQCAYEFMDRHHIPSMVICDVVSWKSSFNALPINCQSSHICIESKASETQESRILKRLPIDFTTFDKIDAKQLNKNMACLIDPALLSSPAIIPRTAPLVPTDIKAPVPGDVEKNLSKSTMVGGTPPHGYRALIQQILFVALGFVVCTLCYAACRTGIIMASSYMAGRADLVAPTAVLTPPTSSIGHVQSSVALTSTPVATVDRSVSKNMAIVTYGDVPSSLSLPHNELLVNKSDRFQVQVIGDCHMIIKAPAKLKVRRRDPGFKISVARGPEQLDNLTLSKLFDGVYTVKIDREDAYGILNVTITMAKVGITEVHEVDFGTPWLKAAGWKKAASKAQEDIGTVQEAAFAFAQTLAMDLGSTFRTWSNFTAGVGCLYHDAARYAEAFSTNAQTFARLASERAQATSNKLLITSTKQHAAASKALADSTSVILNKAYHLREASVKVIAKAQARAKQIARESRQRKNLRKAARVAGNSRCGRKGMKCNR